DGEPRIAGTTDLQSKPPVHYREGGRDWSELTGPKWMPKESEPFGFAAHDRTMYIADAAPEGFGLFAVKIDGGEPKLLASGKVPPSQVVRDRASGRVVAVAFEPDLPSYVFVEPEHPLSRLISGLQAA